MTSHKIAGFTLLEVMIVLVLLLTGLIALSQLLSASLRQSVEAEEKTSIQMICQNRLNRILSGEEAISAQRDEPIPGFNGWFLTIHAERGPVEGLLRLRVTAQKQERVEEPSADRPGGVSFSYVPIAGQRVVLAEWVRKKSVTFERGADPTVGTLNGGTGGTIGSLSTAPFAALPTHRTGVFLPGEDANDSANGTRRKNRRRPSANEEEGGSRKIGGDPISESLLERARQRMAEEGG